MNAADAGALRPAAPRRQHERRPVEPAGPLDPALPHDSLKLHHHHRVHPVLVDRRLLCRPALLHEGVIIRVGVVRLRSILLALVGCTGRGRVGVDGVLDANDGVRYSPGPPRGADRMGVVLVSVPWSGPAPSNTTRRGHPRRRHQGVWDLDPNDFASAIAWGRRCVPHHIPLPPHPLTTPPSRARLVRHPLLPPLPRLLQARHPPPLHTPVHL